MWWTILLLLFSETFRNIFFIGISIVIIIGIYIGIKIGKKKSIMQNSLSDDERFLNAKKFNLEGDIPIMISESGYIGIIDYFLDEIKVINIKDVNGIELQINNNKNSFGTIGVSIGSIFGNMGTIERKVNSIKIILKMNNFDEPVIELPFLSYEIDVDSNKYNDIQEEINRLVGTLEYLINKYSKNNEVRPHCT